MSFVQSVTNTPGEYYRVVVAKVSASRICLRGGFLDLVVYCQLDWLIYGTPYRLWSYLHSDLDPSTKLSFWDSHSFIPLFHYNVLSSLPSFPLDPPSLPPSLTYFSRYSCSLTRVLCRFCYCFVVQTGKRSVFLFVLSLWCLFITWDLNFH